MVDSFVDDADGEMKMVGRALAEPLFEEEDPATEDIYDAEHWLNIYTSLIAFKDHVIDTMRWETSRLPHQVMREGQQDIDNMTAQRDRYATRQIYWKYRAAGLKGIDLDGKSRVLRFQGRLISLTRREVDLMDFLLTYPGQSISTRRLQHEACSGQVLSEEQVRVHISNLRHKLQELIEIQIHSEIGKGYRLHISV